MTTNSTSKSNVLINDYDFLNDKYTQDIIKTRNWSWTEDDGTIHLCWCTPNAIEFTMDIDRFSFLSDFEYQANDFDVDEYVKLWINYLGDKGFPGTVKELLVTAEYIKKELAEVVRDTNLTVAINTFQLTEFGRIGTLYLMYSEEQNTYSVWAEGKNLGNYPTIKNMLQDIIMYHFWLI